MMAQAFLLCYIVTSSRFVRRWIVAPTCSTCLVLICERETAIILLFGSVVYAAFYAISCLIRHPLRPLLALPRPLFPPRPSAAFLPPSPTASSSTPTSAAAL